MNINKNTFKKKYDINKYKYFVYLLLIAPISYLNGQTLQDIQNLQNEYDKFKKNSQSDILNPEFDKKVNSNNPEQRSIKIYSPPDSVYGKSHFGYNFLVRKDTLKLWENLPMPKNYIIGSGDEIIVSMWGQTQLRESYIVSRDGTIFDDKIGILNLSGKTLKDVENFFKVQFGRVYSTLNGSNPTTFIDISIGKLRSINVNFVGEFLNPGIYPIHPFSNIILGVIQSGGIDTSGSLRNISIVRDTNKKLNVDLYDYLLKGKITNDMQLRDGDIIIVPPRKSYVYIDSSISRPGIYESLEGETINDLITHAGGVTFDASQNISVSRIFNQKFPKVKNKSFYLTQKESMSELVLPGDRIVVYPAHKYIQYVEVIGQIKSPGLYPFYEGMTFDDLIKLSSGFEDPTYFKSVYNKQAEIIRRNPEGRYDKVIKVKLEKDDKGNFPTTILQNLDRLVIHANLNFFEKQNVEITGEVQIPGSYPILTETESLESIIYRAGGFTNKALEGGISIFRDVKYFNLETVNEENIQKLKKVRVGWESPKITLMPGDSIVVKEKTNTILVYGEVYNPGSIEFKKNKSISYYLNSAGGLTENGNKDGIVIEYANGIVVPVKIYSRRKVLQGSTIFVNEKINKEPLNITQFAASWTSIISSLITAVVVSQQLSNN